MAEVASYSATADGVAKKKMQGIIKILPDKRLVVGDYIKWDPEREFGGVLESLAFLTHEHGVTYIGTGAGAQDLEPSVVAESKPAQLLPTSMHLTTRMTHELLSAADSKGPKAYENYLTGSMKRLKKSGEIREEMKKILGGLSLAQINATGTATTATLFTFVIKEGSYAPMPWIGSKNMMLDAYTAAGVKINTTATLRVTSFIVGSRTVAVSGAAADVTALVAATTDVYFYYRSAYGNVGYGIVQVASLTSSSAAYLNITPSAYPDVWTGTQVDWDHLTQLYTWDLLNQGIEEAMGRGMEGDIVCFPSMKAWRQLCSNMEALRVLDHSYSATKTEIGHKLDSVSYHAVNGAEVTIRPSPCMPRGLVVAMVKPNDLNEICMAGSDTLKFGIPGKGVDSNVVEQIPRTNYVELQMFSRNDLWAPCPNQFAVWRVAP